MFVYFFCLLFCFLQASVAHDGSPYGLIDAVQTECEYQALTWGTRLTDAWNSYDESVSFKDRFGHDFFYQSASFSKIIHYEMVRRPELFEGVPHHHKHVTHKSGMHKGAPPFHPLLDKWIYLLGDSSLYSVWTSMRGPIQAHEQSTAPTAATFEQCQKFDPLPPRKSSSSFKVKIYDHTEGQHIVDGQACHVKGYGPTGKLSYERRDLLVENLPENKDFFSTHPVFSPKPDAEQSIKLPDVLVVQVARHTCTLGCLKETKDADNWMRITEANQAKLMKQLQELKQQLKREHNHTLNVVLMLPGRTLYNATTVNSKTFEKAEYRSIYDDLDYCMWRLNGLMTFVAHEHGIPVHWREEIEHRLLLRTEHFYGTHDMQAVASNGDIAVEHVSFFNRPKCEQLVQFPGSQVVAASLIEMLHCFDKNQTFAF